MGAEASRSLGGVCGSSLRMGVIFLQALKVLGSNAKLLKLSVLHPVEWLPGLSFNKSSDKEPITFGEAHDIIRQV